MQLLPKELSGHFHDIKQGFAFFLALLFALVHNRHWQACLGGQPFHSFMELQPVQFSQKFKVVSRRAATKTIVSPLAIFTMKARSLFAMKRTTGPVVTLCRVRLFLVERHTLPDNFGDAKPVANIVKEGVWEPHFQLLTSNRATDQ